jgi:hypothetical protein
MYVPVVVFLTQGQLSGDLLNLLTALLTATRKNSSTENVYLPCINNILPCINNITE